MGLLSCLQISLWIIPLIFISLLMLLLLRFSLSSRFVILTLEIGDVMIAILLSKESHLVHFFAASGTAVLPCGHHHHH